MALLDIVAGAALRCNIPVPAAAIGVSDTNVQKLIAFAQDAGDEAMERWGWLNLKGASTFTGNGVTTLFTPPAGFETLYPSITFVSSLYPTLKMPGPINEDDLLLLKSLPAVVTPSSWRRIGTQIEFYPALADQEVVSYVYSGALWITNSSGTPNATGTWQADTDLSLIPERLIRLGAIWRWKRSQGLDYAQEFEDYETTLDRRAGQENTERVIAMSDKMSVVDLDTYFPGTITYTGP